MPFPVSFEVATPEPKADAVVDRASFRPGTFAPGSLVSIFGRGVGPQTAVGLRTTELLLVDRETGARVCCSMDLPRHCCTYRPGRSNAIVPFAVAGASARNVELERDGRRSKLASHRNYRHGAAPFSQPTALGRVPAHSKLGFVEELTGAPADRGSVLVLYATGGGAFARRKSRMALLRGSGSEARRHRPNRRQACHRGIRRQRARNGSESRADQRASTRRCKPRKGPRRSDHRRLWMPARRHCRCSVTDQKAPKPWDLVSTAALQMPERAAQDLSVGHEKKPPAFPPAAFARSNRPCN
jgi:uncharacterized protein (TIGR03437 family)